MPRPRSKGSATPVASPSRPSQPYSRHLPHSARVRIEAAALTVRARAILRERARSVRRLTLTLKKPQTTLLLLPYVSVVRVPAGSWGSAADLRGPLIFPYEINKTKTFLKQRLALESLQGGAL